MSRPFGVGPVPNDPSSVDEVLRLLRAQGGRVTPSRRTMVEVLFEADGHMTAEELASAVQARSPEVHISTIYRTVEDLQRLGVVTHTHLGHGPATYQLASGAHGHFICEACGATLEAPGELFADLARSIKDKLGFNIDPYHFAILGLCASCDRAGGVGAPAVVRASGKLGSLASRQRRLSAKRGDKLAEPGLRPQEERSRGLGGPAGHQRGAGGVGAIGA